MSTIWNSYCGAALYDEDDVRSVLDTEQRRMITRNVRASVGSVLITQYTQSAHEDDETCFLRRAPSIRVEETDRTMCACIWCSSFHDTHVISILMWLTAPARCTSAFCKLHALRSIVIVWVHMLLVVICQEEKQCDFLFDSVLHFFFRS